MARPTDQALVASQSSPQAVSTEGFDPSRIASRAPFRFGNTFEGRMILDNRDNYFCFVHVEQAGGGAIGSITESIRRQMADDLLAALNAIPALAASSEPHEIAYVQFSEDGQNIRKWSRSPFDGGRKCRIELPVETNTFNHNLATMAELDEELDAEHPGWMTEATDEGR